MPTAIALRSFEHNGTHRKGEPVTFDEQTMKALRRSGLVSKDDTDSAPKPEPVVATGGKRPGKKSAALRAGQVLLPPTVQPSSGGVPLPPLPEK